MIASAVPSRAASAAGVPARYLYWHGASGRRYLFSMTDAAALADFTDGVAIAVSGGAIVWIGDLAEPRWPAAPCIAGGTAVYVHLLAATAEEKRALVADLRPPRPAHLRLAA